jgi:formamidopyrimidine-DNA glycosylase
MPELPEVEHAARVAHDAVQGRVLRAIRGLHPSVLRDGALDAAAALVGRTVQGVRRVAKWQEFTFDDGAVLVVHFRMTGDWAVTATPAPPRHARIHLHFDGDRHLWLVDPRVLGRVQYRAPGALGDVRVGPDAHDSALTPATLRARLAARRIPIKQALLDQRLVAGLGNIYAAEALWHARIHPATPAARLSLARVERLLAGIRWTLDAALTDPGRQAYGESLDRLAVYDREAAPCLRCTAPIRRIVQGQRSTYYCPRCQRA